MVEDGVDHRAVLEYQFCGFEALVKVTLKYFKAGPLPRWFSIPRYCSVFVFLCTLILRLLECHKKVLFLMLLAVSYLLQPMSSTSTKNKFHVLCMCEQQKSSSSLHHQLEPGSACMNK